jgi:hypothetical protein
MANQMLLWSERRTLPVSTPLIDREASYDRSETTISLRKCKVCRHPFGVQFKINIQGALAYASHWLTILTILEAKMLKSLSFLFFSFTLTCLTLNSSAFASGDLVEASSGHFPIAPNSKLTPGMLCSKPTSYRYPENIAYCERDVTPQAKHKVIEVYDNELGYKIAEMNRQDFKIDHYIPLCMGGDNSENNLWPQHKSVYVVTDPLEKALCEKMAAGDLNQTDAIRLIKKAKADLREVEKIFIQVQALRLDNKVPRP